MPFIVFVGHSAVLRTWIVDDAGISFAYARNLAAGHGLVAQPGASPVEGYSNPLWVGILSLFWALRLFHEIWTPKLASYTLVAVTFLILARCVSREGKVGGQLFAFCLAMLALQPGFAIWCVSGLENPLYVLLLSALFCRTIADLRGGADPQRQVGSAAGAGLLAAGVALTRPEGLLYAAVYPVLIGAATANSREGSSRLVAMGTYGVCSAVPVTAYLFFRRVYFADIVPNVYYSKGGPALDVLWAALTFRAPGIAAARELFTAMAGPADLLLLGAFLCALAATVITGRLWAPTVACLAFLGVSLGAYLLLPADWMGEYRFGTPFFLFAYVCAGLLWGAFARAHASWRGTLTAFVIAIACVATAYQRTAAFAIRPTVPLAAVTAYNATGYNRLADLLQVRDGSLLTPDVGGTLLFSRLRVYDLGMLCDRTIATTMGRHQQAFYDYVFGQVRPTFIVSGGVWVERAALERDPRFTRDYVSIRPLVGAVITARNPTGAFDYVRRDVLAARLSSLSPQGVNILKMDLRDTLNVMNNDF